MRDRRIATWTSGILAATAIAFAAEVVRKAHNYPPSLLLSCMKVEVAWRGWVCKQVLMYGSLREDQVAELNREAGAWYPLTLPDPVEAEEMLNLFISRGVDVNARTLEAEGGLTPLQILVTDRNVEGVRIILRHGARMDPRNIFGMTELDLARKERKKSPQHKEMDSIIKMLEEAEAHSNRTEMQVTRGTGRDDR